MPGQGCAKEARPGRSLADNVSAWIEKREAADQLVAEWQRLEHELSVEARSRRADFVEILESDLPASQRMRELAKQITVADKRLGKAACRLVGQPSMSTDDALAKIRLGLQLAECPLGDEAPWALVKAGFDDLQAMLEQAPKRGEITDTPARRAMHQSR